MCLAVGFPSHIKLFFLYLIHNPLLFTIEYLEYYSSEIHLFCTIVKHVLATLNDVHTNHLIHI